MSEPAHAYEHSELRARVHSSLASINRAEPTRRPSATAQVASIEEIAQDLESHHEALLRQGIGDPAATEQVLASLDHDRGLKHHLRHFAPTEPSPWLTVVGIVDDVRQWINTPPEPTLYWANAEQAEFAVVMRTTADPSALSTAAARVVRELDPLQPVFDVQTMRDRLEGSQQLTYERFCTAIMSGFGLAALLLAGLGMYGVVRYSVTQRTQEFGIRLALGASPQQIFGMVLRHSLRATAVGGALGVLGSIAVGRSLASVLYGGVSTQPIIMIAVAVLLAGLSAIAAIGPARRASRVDPLIALRSE